MNDSFICVSVKSLLPALTGTPSPRKGATGGSKSSPVRGTHRRAASGRGGTPTTESNPRSQEGYTSIRDDGGEYWVFEKSGTKSVPPKCPFLISSVSYPKNRVIFAVPKIFFRKKMLFFHEAEFCSRNIWNFRRKKKKFLPQVFGFC